MKPGLVAKLEEAGFRVEHTATTLAADTLGPTAAVRSPARVSSDVCRSRSTVSLATERSVCLEMASCARWAA